MSTARDDILRNIRRSLGVTGREAPRHAAVDERLRGAPRGVVPARGQLAPEARVALFRREAEMVAATTAQVQSAADVPAEVARFLRDHNLPATLRLGSDQRLAGLDWSATALAISTGPSDGDDLNAISHAFAGIAETGTAVLVSGSDNPTSLNFLPDNHIVIIQSAQIMADTESVWARLRETYGKANMPRTVNLITGPSRSGDIEQQIILGAHGPRRLHIIVVDA
jgi:L-lactate dehydrogenase complex protein LldG